MGRGNRRNNEPQACTALSKSHYLSLKARDCADRQQLRLRTRQTAFDLPRKQKHPIKARSVDAGNRKEWFQRSTYSLSSRDSSRVRKPAQMDRFATLATRVAS
ncbi:hypothetical protein V5799_011205 [Amblyomma americanum]|uniref:Uncharacterized protein n=1 Tax=Amblyomma americanum TaxID=6943 RepID=A0AAQ4EHR9_AMBAM